MILCLSPTSGISNFLACLVAFSFCVHVHAFSGSSWSYASSICSANYGTSSFQRSQSRYLQSLDTPRHSLAINTESNNDCKSKPLTKKIIDGLKVAPAVASLPLYGMAFAVVGPKTVWRFSKWIYGQANPSDDVLTAHFDRVSAYLYSGREIASQKLLSYKIHPLFAGLSMISTALLAFVDRASINKVITYQRLLLLNAAICFVSALAAFPISKIMIGNQHAKKWIIIQGKLSMLYAMLSFCQGTLGRVMIHLNWAILFAGGAIERIWVLCIMSQLDIPDRKTYLKLYSPQIKAAALGGIPLGLLTYFLCG